MCCVVLVLAMRSAVLELGASSVGGTEIGCQSGVINSITFKTNSSVVQQIVNVTCISATGAVTPASPTPSNGAADAAASYTTCTNGKGFSAAAAAVSTDATAGITTPGLNDGGADLCRPGGSSRKLEANAPKKVSCSGSTRVVGLRSKTGAVTTALGLVCAGNQTSLASEPRRLRAQPSTAASTSLSLYDLSHSNLYAYAVQVPPVRVCVYQSSSLALVSVMSISHLQMLLH